MEPLYLPTLHTLENDNIFTGSYGALRFKITPQTTMRLDDPREVDGEKSTLRAEFWHGPFCYEKSTVEGERTFPLTKDGREALLSWLNELAK